MRVVASDERSQARNRQLALERLRSRLAEGLRVDQGPPPDRAVDRPRANDGCGEAPARPTSSASAPAPTPSDERA